MASSEVQLPELIDVEVIRQRLAELFPESFPDRTLLVGSMCARAVFVFLYGGFLAGTGRLLRPAHIYFFTQEQAQLTDPAARMAWVELSAKQGFRPAGKRWYADTTRESLRDDLIRNRLLTLGIVTRNADLPTTSSKPAYALALEFAALLAPKLKGAAIRAPGAAGWPALLGL